MRKAKVITKKEDIGYIANIKEDDITTSFFMEMFGGLFNALIVKVLPNKKRKKRVHKKQK